jgi:very-short-patch-repair endonuclease
MRRSFGLNRSELFLAYDRNLVHRAKELRKNPTAAERKLWEDYLCQFPHRVLRQRPIDHFIVDFYCSALRLVIEVDWEIHNSEQSQVYDDDRSKILHSYGLTVLRLTNAEVMEEFDRTCAKIQAFGDGELSSRPDPPNPLEKGGPEFESGECDRSPHYSQTPPSFSKSPFPRGI